LSERTLRIIRIVVVVLNVMVAVVSFRRGDTSAMVIAIAVAALFLIQRARPPPDGRAGARRGELVRVGVELFAEGTLDRTHVNEIIKRAGVSRTLFYHYFPSKMAFARAIVEYEILHLHGLVEQQTALTLEGAISTFAGYVKARPDSLRALHTGGLDQDPEIAAALATSF